MELLLSNQSLLIFSESRNVVYFNLSQLICEIIYFSVEMARNQGQRMSGASTPRMNNMVVARQQQQNQAMAQTHQSTVGQIMYISQPPFQYYNANNNANYYGNKQTVRNF